MKPATQIDTFTEWTDEERGIPTNPRAQTATPWRVGNKPSVEFDEPDTPDRFITDDASNGTLAVATAHGDNQQEADANAAYIVHCVNSHANLISGVACNACRVQSTHLQAPRSNGP